MHQPNKSIAATNLEADDGGSYYVPMHSILRSVSEKLIIKDSLRLTVDKIETSSALITDTLQVFHTDFENLFVVNYANDIKEKILQTNKYDTLNMFTTKELDLKPGLKHEDF